MKFHNIATLSFCLFLGACATNYGPLGKNGGYIDKPVDNTTYLLRYQGSTINLFGNSYEQIEPLWEKRAEELCGSKDFFKETERDFVKSDGNQNLHGAFAIVGAVYCNNKILDSRKQIADENFQQFQALPEEAFTSQEISPLWSMLSTQQYTLLQKEVDKIASELTAEEANILLATFSRTTPTAEADLANWIKSYPDSHLPYFARSLYYENIAWFKRGSGSGVNLTPEQREDFEKYSKLASADISKSITLNPAFCPAHQHKLNIYTGLAGTSSSEYAALFAAALKQCPNYIGIYQANLRYLLPRWHGSKQQMRSFIDSSLQTNKKLNALEALYIAEEGDQLMFANTLDMAIEKYNEALTYGDFPYIYNQRALAFERSTRFVESIKDYSTTIKMSPYDEGAYIGLTRVLLKQNNLVGALIATNYAIALNNQDASTFEIQGDILYTMRRYDDALISYRKAAIISGDKAVHQHKIRKAEYQIDVRKQEKADKPQQATI